MRLRLTPSVVDIPFSLRYRPGGRLWRSLQRFPTKGTETCTRRWSPPARSRIHIRSIPQEPRTSLRVKIETSNISCNIELKSIGYLYIDGLFAFRLLLLHFLPSNGLIVYENAFSIVWFWRAQASDLGSELR